MNNVYRPQPPIDKITTKENFELTYLRHQYFRRVKYNPTEEEMRPFMKIVEHFTKNTFYVYQNLFKSVGMYHDDILNIGRVHLVSFLGLYALDKMDDKKKAFEENTLKYKFREATDKDYRDQDKANFTLFLKQRMEDLVRVCYQKVRNIRGQPSQEYQVFYGTNCVPKQYKRILKEYKELGYRKLDFSIFKSIRKKANVDSGATIFQFKDVWYIAIPLDKKELDIDDLIGSDFNPYQNNHNKQPDDIYEEKEQDAIHKNFNNRSVHARRNILRRFVKKNNNRRGFKDEVGAAKKLLRALGD